MKSVTQMGRDPITGETFTGQVIPEPRSNYRLLASRDEAAGKTVERATSTWRHEAVLFIDKTAIVTCVHDRYGNSDDAYIDIVVGTGYLDAHTMVNLGLIERADYDAWKEDVEKRRAEDDRKERLAAFDRLKAEFEPENSA